MLTITRQFKLCPCIKLCPQRCITKSTKIKKSHNNHKHAFTDIIKSKILRKIEDCLSLY